MRFACVTTLIAMKLGVLEIALCPTPMSSKFYPRRPFLYSSNWPRLVDDEGNDITDFDVRGELCVRGPTVVRCYFNNEKANKESWDEDGFFHTGDVMYCDGKTKKWYIVDRKKVCWELNDSFRRQLTMP